MRKVNLRNVDPAIDDPDASTWCKHIPEQLYSLARADRPVHSSPPDPESPFTTRGRRKL